jgi:hypothetical protein
MSITYRPLSTICIDDLIDGRMKNVRVHERRGLKHGPCEKCLTDGENFLWVDFDAEGEVTRFRSYIPNGDPHYILSAIAQAFDVQIVSELEPKFWGFETQAEWDASWEALAEQHEQQFYGEVMKFVRGEPNDIKPGTIGMNQAEIIKGVVAEFPDLFWLWTSDRS